MRADKNGIEMVFCGNGDIIAVIPEATASKLLYELREGGIPGAVWESVSTSIRQRITREVRGPTTMDEAVDDGYSADEMRAVLTALSHMTYHPNAEDAATAKGILDQARAKGLL